MSKNLFQRIVEFAGITALSFSLLACPRKEQKSSPDEKQSVVQVSTEQISSYKQEYGMKEEGKSKQEEKELAGKGLLEDLTNQLVEEQNEALAKTIETNKADNPPGRIYFSGKKEGNFELYCKEGDTVTRLTSTQGHESSVAVSIDGKLLAHDKNDGEYRHIYVMDLNTKEIHQITFGPYWDSQPAWDPKMEEIAFKRYLGGFDSDIMIVNLEAGEVQSQPLTKNDEMTSDHSPSYDPEGKTIAYIREEVTITHPNRINPDSTLCIMNRDGTGKRDVKVKIRPNSVPRWNPQGDRIVLEGIMDGYTTIAQINHVEGGIKKLLTYKEISKAHPGVHFTNPSYSPNGRQIIFEVYTIANSDAETISALCVMDVDGGNRGYLVSDFGRVKEPVWVR